MLMDIVRIVILLASYRYAIQTYLSTHKDFSSRSHHTFHITDEPSSTGLGVKKSLFKKSLLRSRSSNALDTRVMESFVRFLIRIVSDEPILL